MQGDVEALRADASAIEHLGITEIVDHYDGIIRGLEAPPIIMGHSFGGAFTQLLLHRGLGAAGVASNSAAVRGILTLPLSRLRSARAVAQARRVARCAALLVLRAGGRGPFARGQ